MRPGAEPEQREGGRVAERAAVEVEQAHRQLVVQEQGYAPGYREHRQRRDERDHAAVRDRDRVDRAEQRREADRPDDEDERRALGVDQDASEHARRGQHGPDGEIDPRRGDHERHAHREHAHDARLGEHVADVVPGGEAVRLEDRAGHEQQHDHDHQRVLLECEAAETPLGSRCPRSPPPARRPLPRSSDLLHEVL